MTKAFKTLFILFALIIVAVSCHAQKESNTTTIILLRHAEKDTADGVDPGLTEMGKFRAQRLVKLFPNAIPDEMYATPYVRTRETLASWAKATGLTIKDFKPGQLDELAELLKIQKGKTIVVAGHSNTTPALANLLLNTDRYTAWEDNVYNKLFVITITKGKAKGTVIEY